MENIQNINYAIKKNRQKNEIKGLKKDRENETEEKILK